MTPRNNPSSWWCALELFTVINTMFKSIRTSVDVYKIWCIASCIIVSNYEAINHICIALQTSDSVNTAIWWFDMFSINECCINVSNVDVNIDFSSTMQWLVIARQRKIIVHLVHKALPDRKASKVLEEISECRDLPEWTVEKENPAREDPKVKLVSNIACYRRQHVVQL